VCALAVLIVGVALLAGPRAVLAQHGGRGHSRPLICVYDCPDTPDRAGSEDDLKTFERLMAVQATADQGAAFLKVMQYAQTASTLLQAFRDLLKQATPPTALSDGVTSLDRSIEEARAGNQNFLASFSPVQKSGLKDVTERLLKTDADLNSQIKMLDRALQIPKAEAESLTTSAVNLDKALASFQSAQLALAGEMSIILPSSGQGLTVNLPPVTSLIDVAGQSISVPTSGLVSRTSAADGQELFNLKLVADLSALQQDITGILRAQLAPAPRCGERIEVRQATFIPQPPASLVAAHLHVERWICPPGWDSPTELAAGEGYIEVKLTPSVGPNASLHLVSEISRVDADGSLRDSLLTGSLGTTLREQITFSILSALQKGADLKTALPPAARDAATIQKAQFQGAEGHPMLVLNGQLKFTDEQAKQFASQLKQRLSAQQTPPP
jgi:hypothetical protein